MSAEDMKTVEDALRWALSRIDPMNRGDYWDRASRILADADTNPEAAAPLMDERILEIAKNPLTSPCSPWWLKDDVLCGDIRNAAIVFARAIEREVRASLARQAPEAAAPAGFALVPPDLERLRHIDAQIWEDLAAALTEAKDGHHNAELDELDCVLLLDLVRLYRRAAAAPAVPPQGAAAALAEEAERAVAVALSLTRKAAEMPGCGIEQVRLWEKAAVARTEAFAAIRRLASQAAPAAPKGEAR